MDDPAGPRRGLRAWLFERRQVGDDEAIVRARGAERGAQRAGGAAAPSDSAASDPAATDPTGADGTAAPRGGGLRSLRTFLIVAVVAVVGALLLRTFVVAPYYVPSASMEPTLHGCQGCNDDHVLVEKLSYLFHDVQAGDVVVFDRPSSGPWSALPDKVLIKRVIGVAGDRLVIRDGRVFRNGQELSEPYVNQHCTPETTASPGSTSTAAKVFATVPTGRIFVMGDNRCDSEDSRLLGTIPTSDVVGRAFVIIWPVGRIHSL